MLTFPNLFLGANPLSRRLPIMDIQYLKKAGLPAFFFLRDSKVDWVFPMNFSCSLVFPMLTYMIYSPKSLMSSLSLLKYYWELKAHVLIEKTIYQT